jgi:hypothetical protein
MGMLWVLPAMNGIMKDFIIRACEDPFFGLIHFRGRSGFAQMAAALEQEKRYLRAGWT